MDLSRLKGQLSIGMRTFGVLVLAAVLLAACGDDDDDTDVGDDIDTIPTIEMVATEADDAETMTDEGTATEAEMDVTEEEDGTATEPDDDMVGTSTEEDDGTATEEDSAEGTSTESDNDMTGTATEEDDDGTATESDDDVTATEEDETATSDADEGTATESDDDDATPTEADNDVTATESDSSEDTASLGDAVDVEGFTITVEEVEAIFGVPGVLEPSSGHQFVALTVTIENTGGDPLSLLSALSGVYLETGDGERYDVDLRANAVLLFEDDGIAATRIESNSEVTGKIGFEIPEDVEDLMLVIENDATGDNVVIDLSDEFAS